MQVILRKEWVMLGALALAVFFAGNASAQVCPQDVGVERGTKHAPVADPEGGWQPRHAVTDWWGPMPQTSYTPNYGCYPGNARTINRAPAFHGYTLRSPYNYRMYSEFPWHADITEPEPYPVQTMGDDGVTGRNMGGAYDGQEIIIREEYAPSAPLPMPAAKATSSQVPTPAKPPKAMNTKYFES